MFKKLLKLLKVFNLQEVLLEKSHEGKKTWKSGNFSNLSNY